MPQTKMEGERTFHMDEETACSKLQMGSKGLHMGNCKYLRTAGMDACWGEGGAGKEKMSMGMVR